MRRPLLVLLLLALPLAARAQPWANEAQRLAGRQGLAAAAAGRWGEAESYAATADPLAAKIMAWMRLTSRGAPVTAGEVIGFITDSPDWPLPEALQRRAEQALQAEPEDALALRLFLHNTPRTLGGAQRLADALNNAGRGEDGARVARRAWGETPGDPFAEDAFLGRYAGLLTEDDSWARFDRLAFARDLAGAGRAAQRLAGTRRGVAEARLALAAERGDAESLADGRTTDIGLAYERARWLRRRDRDAEAAAAWAAAEGLQRGLGAEAQRAIWTERQVLARKLLRLGQDREAYRVAANHGQSQPGELRQEAEFLAGWIALRRLNDAASAQRHFARVGEGSHSVITRARAAYWEGRALAARGDAAGARARYEAAATLPVAYYGQIASVALGEDAVRLAARVETAPVPAVAADRAQAFLGRELARAVQTLADLGDTRRARIFLLRLEDLAADGTDRALTARLAVSIGRPDHAVWVARRAGADGDILLAEGWPMPYRPPVETPEPAFLFAITRQESNFDTEAVSGSNARGLMQLLPSTASQMARQLGLAHQVGMLTADPQHNIRLGAGYLEQMLARYDGALALAAAAYNAGPGRVDEWLGTYGDPRWGAVDMLDWIELIPFTETRNYVQRVVENVVVYRARTGFRVDHPLTRWLRAAP